MPRRTWAIGDIQGCYDGLRHLLAAIDFDAARDQLVCVGDLINRGPQSLETLRFLCSLGGAATSVLGNHDLHFLGVVAGVRQAGKSDTLNDLLNAPDLADLVDWLRQRPLHIEMPGYVITHAGIPASWRTQSLRDESRWIEQLLRSPNWKQAFTNMFGNEPSLPNSTTDAERLRYGVNALTRLRFVRSDGGLDMLSKESAPPDGSDLRPWFEVPDHQWFQQAKAPKIVFGHWATLGVFENERVVSIDGGYVWGRDLVAYRLHGDPLPDQTGRFIKVTPPPSISA